MDIVYMIHIGIILLIWGLFQLYNNFKLQENYTTVKPGKIKNKKKVRFNNKPEYFSYEESKVDPTHSGFINPEIYVDLKNTISEPITGTNIGTYNIVKNPVDKIDYKELPLPPARSIKWKRQRIWQQTWI